MTTFDETLTALVADMAATMVAAGGTGLAANQVGVDLKVFVFDCVNAKGERVSGVVCNPVLEYPSDVRKKSMKNTEGCLSLPGLLSTDCPRPESIVVRGVDHHNQPVEYHGSGFLAVCLEHEYDHLQGKVYGDRLSQETRTKLEEKHQSIAKHFPSDWPVSSAATQWTTMSNEKSSSKP